jgi:GNAT superfamily N-acetyltransferase
VNGTRARIPGVAAVSLRRAGPDDAETLFTIHRESAMTAYAHVFPPDRYPFPEEEMRAHWVAQLGDSEATTVIAERDGVAVGFVAVSPGWMRNLFVLPSEWGRGAGSALHDEAVELLRGAGVSARLWVLEANVRARRFYEQRGWRHDGERRASDYPPYPPVLRYELDL